jgi:hypothetical protein
MLGLNPGKQKYSGKKGIGAKWGKSPAFQIRISKCNRTGFLSQE